MIVEAAVQVATRFIIAKLRNRRFFSLTALNAAIAELVAQLNDRMSRHLGRADARSSRRWTARRSTRCRPSPTYVFAAWKECRVGLDYHVEIDKHYYSPPSISSERSSSTAWRKPSSNSRHKRRPAISRTPNGWRCCSTAKRPAATPSRPGGAVHALKLLDTYHGIVQCDGYAAYKNIANAAYLGEAITLAFCWAHLRRKFFEIAKGGSAPIASEALDRIALLYAIEKTIRGRSADERRAVRQEKSKPLVLALKTWLEEQLARVSAKSVIAEAIRYGLNHWDGLVRFLEDGRIELDTNIVERSMRPIVLNRKNALFAGHDQGAENWAAIASLVETCKLHGVDPQAYFADVLTKLVNLWPASRLDELMPWAWAAPRSTDHLAA